MPQQQSKYTMNLKLRQIVLEGRIKPSRDSEQGEVAAEDHGA